MINNNIGNWDQIYNAILNNEHLNLSELSNINAELNYEYTSIVSKNYHDKLKNIYMPPFSLFSNMSLEWLKNNVLSIYGEPNLSEIKQLIKLANEDVILCISHQHLNQNLYDSISESNIKLIVVLDCIDNFKFTKTNNILLISEHNQIDYVNSVDQTIERLLYAFANKLLILNNTNFDNLNSLTSNYDDDSKEIYYLKSVLDKNNEQLLNNVEAKLALSISEIGFN